MWTLSQFDLYETLATTRAHRTRTSLTTLPLEEGLLLRRRVVDRVSSRTRYLRCCGGAVLGGGGLDFGLATTLLLCEDVVRRDGVGSLRLFIV